MKEFSCFSLSFQDVFLGFGEVMEFIPKLPVQNRVGSW